MMAILEGIVDKIMAFEVPWWVLLIIIIGIALWLFFRPIESTK